MPQGEFSHQEAWQLGKLTEGYTKAVTGKTAALRAADSQVAQSSRDAARVPLELSCFGLAGTGAPVPTHRHWVARWVTTLWDVETWASAATDSGT